jgi:hypothetical protein
MSNAQKVPFSSNIDWQSLDLVVRGWIAMSGFEKDQSDYQKMKEQYQ